MSVPPPAEPSSPSAGEPSQRPLEELRWRCDRTLAAHGAVRPRELLDRVSAELGDIEPDRYGKGGVVAELEEEVAALLGKPAAVFMPSGTMAQQIVLRIHADRRGRRTVAWHPTCHLDLHELQALAQLHGLLGRPVGSARTVLDRGSLADVHEPLAALVLELPQREIGGQLPEWEDLTDVVALAREKGAAVHLDGARLWECGPHYGRELAEIAELFDSVYVSFYKGLGGLAGCALLGDADVVDEAREWRSRHGGTLFAMWPYAAAALAGLRTRLPRMAAYVGHARAIADELRGLDGVEVVPDPPPTPMMNLHLRVPADDARAALRRLAESESLWTWPDVSPTDSPSWQRVELAVGDATLEFTPAEVRQIVCTIRGDETQPLPT